MKALKLVGTSFALLLVICFVPFTNSCSYPQGWTPPTTIENIKYAEVILWGKILQTYPHRRYDTAYSAKMEVYCIIRGERTPRTVNITNAGFLPGMCTATELIRGEVYLVPLMENLSAVGVSFKEPGQVEEALKACNLNPPTYPLGVDESTAVLECPAGLSDWDCKDE